MKVTGIIKTVKGSKCLNEDTDKDKMKGLDDLQKCVLKHKKFC